MIRTAITQAAFEAIAKTLPLGSVAVEPQVDANGGRLARDDERGVGRGDDV
jgi:hypothetical protein